MNIITVLGRSARPMEVATTFISTFFRKPANRFEAAATIWDYKAYASNVFALPPEQQEAILVLVEAGMSAKKAFETLEKILDSGELMATAQVAADDYYDAELIRITW